MIFVRKMYVCTEMHGSITYIKSILSCAVIDAIEYVGNTRIWFIIVKNTTNKQIALRVWFTFILVSVFKLALNHT